MSGHTQLPGLRWSELQQITVCLQSHWQDDFDPKTLIPLLYPVVYEVAEEDEEEVRQTLSTIWDELGVLIADKRNFWLDQIIVLSDKDPLWAYEKNAGCYSFGENSLRRQLSEGWRSSAHFHPFFTMLEHYVTKSN